MVTLTHSSRQVKPLPFSFAADLIGETQRIHVELAGFEYPGEIIVAEEWRPDYGKELEHDAMYRLVLLQSSSVPGNRKSSINEFA
ncbi:MAG: hypothetical protein HOF01_05465 [Chloroflexi bacterium]|nr:hypothetical protein [Chloroflexota bacterium]